MRRQLLGMNSKAGFFLIVILMCVSSRAGFADSGELDPANRPLDFDAGVKYWTDPNGLTWVPGQTRKHLLGAKEFCAKMGGWVPNADEFLEAAESGLGNPKVNRISGVEMVKLSVIWLCGKYCRPSPNKFKELGDINEGTTQIFEDASDPRNAFACVVKLSKPAAKAKSVKTQGRYLTFRSSMADHFYRNALDAAKKDAREKIDEICAKEDSFSYEILKESCKTGKAVSHYAFDAPDWPHEVVYWAHCIYYYVCKR